MGHGTAAWGCISWWDAQSLMLFIALGMSFKPVAQGNLLLQLKDP